MKTAIILCRNATKRGWSERVRLSLKERYDEWDAADTESLRDLGIAVYIHFA
jgi:hypothetical protein